MIIVRFAPSPTGFLHIGGARTALFNYVYAKHNAGKFLLRIEDTDHVRSTRDATQAIFDGMQWLGLQHDDLSFQSSNMDRHVEIANKMVASGVAYKCYCPQDEINIARDIARQNKGYYIHKCPYRDGSKGDGRYAIRLKSPEVQGSVQFHDMVFGENLVSYSQLDDIVLLRSDGTPTYMLAVVVDDHDSDVTHVIRGADHLSNTARQISIYKAMNWSVPEFGHIPLIHGSDGAKLSKRHGALGIDWYRDNGFLPQAMRSYLMRLGWSHGNDEIISDENARLWFSFDCVQNSPARFDIHKLEFINNHYIKQLSYDDIIKLIACDDTKQTRECIDIIRNRCKSLVEFSKYIDSFLEFSGSPNDISSAIKIKLSNTVKWDSDAIQNAISEYIMEQSVLAKKEIMQSLRLAITGDIKSPGGIVRLMLILGRDECLLRL